MFTASTTRYDSMSYRRCGSSGLLLPAVSLGLWHNFGGVDSFENSRAMLRRAFDLGITTEVMPEAEGHGRQQETARTAAAIGHGIVAGSGSSEHARLSEPL